MESIIIIIKGAIAAFVGFLIHRLGGLDSLLVALLWAVILDYTTGVLSACHNKVLSSEKGSRGIIKKIMTLAIVALAYLIEGIFSGTLPLREITITFFVVNESISILENAAEIGLPVPEKLKNALIQLKGKEKENERN